MGTKTGISWTDATWNPIRGCSRVSEGCRHCYAESIAHRFSGAGLAYEGLVQLDAAGKSTGKWNGKIKFVEEHLLDPLKWRPVRVPCDGCGVYHRIHECPLKLSRSRRIFVNSMSDLFHENVTDEMRDKIFAVMALCPQHTFQVLTKRPERMLAYMIGHGNSHRRNIPVYNAAVEICAGDFSRMSQQMGRHRSSGEGWWPLPNVHFGVSVEDQKTADLRIPLLLQTPAAVRFISAEPLLGPVMLPRKVHLPRNVRGDFPVGHHLIALSGYHAAKSNPHGALSIRMQDGEFLGIKPSEFEDCGLELDWVIVGGESGAGARPMHPDWARSLRDQCKAAGVPFFFKQWGEWLCSDSVDQPTYRGEHRYLGEHQHAYRIGTKAAGCLLDGVEHHEFPAVSA